MIITFLRQADTFNHHLFKDRVGVEVEFGHSSFIGIDLLKFRAVSYSGLNKIDVGVYCYNQIVSKKNESRT